MAAPSCAPCDDVHITWLGKFATEAEAIEHAKANLKFFPTDRQATCPCGVSSFQADCVNADECELWGEHLPGHSRKLSPDDVRLKGGLCHKCRIVLQRMGTLSKGVKWFTNQLTKPAFLKKHLEARGRYAAELRAAKTLEPSTAIAPIVQQPTRELEDVAMEEAKLAKKGHYEVYTDLNYHLAPENMGRTWQQDNQTLVPKRMCNGEVKNLIYVWTGPTDRWTCSEAEISQIQKRTRITNNLIADDSEVQDAAAAAAKPSLLPDVFQEGMEETEHVQAPADQALPPLPSPPPAAEPKTDNKPEATPASVPANQASGSMPPLRGAPPAAPPSNPKLLTMLMPGKKKRTNGYSLTDVDALIKEEISDYNLILRKLRDNFFHKDVDALLAEIKLNHDSLMKAANQHRKIDEIIELRDNIENLTTIKAHEG